MSAQFSRLAAVSKILYDQELIEARKEIESLKLQLFWKNYNVRNLQSSISTTSVLMPRCCDCKICAEAQRFCIMTGDYENITENNDKPCNFRIMLENKMAELGITFIECPTSAPVMIDHVAAEGLFCGSKVVDVDSHIVIYTKYVRDAMVADDYWFNFTYASRLFKQTTVSNPELKKLEALFKWLNDLRYAKHTFGGRKRSAATAELSGLL